MVDFRKPPATLHSERRDPAVANNFFHDGGDPTRTDYSLQSMVVGGPSPGELSVLVEPVLMNDGDIDWMIYPGKKRYPPTYDPVTVEGWFRNVVLKSPMMFFPIRMPNAFAISMLSVVPWLPSEFECNVVAVCADDDCMWEAMKCLRGSIEWAKKRKVKRWRLVSETTYDLAPFAKRLGAREISPRFELTF